MPDLPDLLFAALIIACVVLAVLGATAQERIRVHASRQDAGYLEIGATYRIPLQPIMANYPQIKALLKSVRSFQFNSLDTIGGTVYANITVPPVSVSTITPPTMKQIQNALKSNYDEKVIEIQNYNPTSFDSIFGRSYIGNTWTNTPISEQ